MKPERTRFGASSRAIESIHSGLLLFGFAILLALFMASVMI